MIRAEHQAFDCRDYESQGNTVYLQCLFGTAQVRIHFNDLICNPVSQGLRPTNQPTNSSGNHYYPLFLYFAPNYIERKKRNLLHVYNMFLAFKSLSEVEQYIYFPVYFFPLCKQTSWKPDLNTDIDLR